ncbi:MAG: hypothetical protein FWE22_07490 [Firmicutes bacterium]|nr:hypothetical protein [Bacillota bacterium]
MSKHKHQDTTIAELTRQYEDALAEQRERIFSLKNELVQKEKIISSFQEKSDLIQKAILNAVTKAEEIESLSIQKYEQEMAQLKAFHEKWLGYYNRIIRDYPLDDNLIQAEKFNKQLQNIFKLTDEKSPKKTMSEVEKTYAEEMSRLGRANMKTETEPQFNPLDKIKTYLSKEEKAVTSSSPISPQKDYLDRSPAGFSFEEAQNPKEDLETIMKQLGLLED